VVHLSPLDGEIALSHKLSDSERARAGHSNLLGAVADRAEVFRSRLLDRLIVCEDDNWGSRHAADGAAR